MDPPRIPPTIPPIAPDEIPEVVLICGDVEVDSVLLDETVVEVGEVVLIWAVVDGIKDELEDVLGTEVIVGVCVAVTITGGFVWGIAGRVRLNQQSDDWIEYNVGVQSNPITSQRSL
jgi:hypothetical protein